MLFCVLVLQYPVLLNVVLSQISRLVKILKCWCDLHDTHPKSVHPVQEADISSVLKENTDSEQKESSRTEEATIAGH